LVFTFDFNLIVLIVNTKNNNYKGEIGMKKVQKTIKINYILSVAIKEFAQKNTLNEIDVIEKALEDFFKEKETNRVHYEILEAVQLLLNNQISMSTDLEAVKKLIGKFELV
jgi:hypothetical protein